MQTNITKLIYTHFHTYLQFILLLALPTVLNNKLEICKNASIHQYHVKYANFANQHIFVNMAPIQRNIHMYSYQAELYSYDSP